MVRARITPKITRGRVAHIEPARACVLIMGVVVMVLVLMVVASETGESFIGCDLFQGIRVLGEARLRCGRLRLLGF